MAIKLEWVLTLMLLFITIGAFTFTIENQSVKKSSFNKELELKETTLIEVDEKKIRSKVEAIYGMSQNGVLTLDYLTYASNKIKSMVADKGRIDDRMVYIDGNIKIRENGYIFTAEHANYHQKKQILNITSPFELIMGPHSVKGEEMSYDILLNNLIIQQVDATYYTAEK